MIIYVVYYIKGNRGPDDIVIEIADAAVDHSIPIRAGVQGPVGPLQWKWTGRNIGVVKERIAAAHPSLSSKYLAKPQVMADLVLCSVQQLVQ